MTGEFGLKKGGSSNLRDALCTASDGAAEPPQANDDPRFKSEFGELLMEPVSMLTLAQFAPPCQRTVDSREDVRARAYLSSTWFPSVSGAANAVFPLIPFAALLRLTVCA